MPGFHSLGQLTLKQWVTAGLLGLLFVVILAAFIWRDDILSTALDPKQPFQTYQPPRAPNYRDRASWALSGSGPGAVDVFFIAPTTYDGGRHWNGPIDDPQAERMLQRVMIPNYAGPFLRVGRLFLPRYRQASLYSQMSLREDARESRLFAYGDILQAFDVWRATVGPSRPFILAGVEQGGFLANRLLIDRIARNPTLRGDLVAVYIIQSATLASEHGPDAAIPACRQRNQSGCIVAWLGAFDDLDVGDTLARNLVWQANGNLDLLHGRPLLCVNPMTGNELIRAAPARANLGAVNATGLEWGARPAFSRGLVSARCDGGLLRISRPNSGSFRPAGSWADRSKVAPYNLFFADLEADALARRSAWQRANPVKP